VSETHQTPGPFWHSRAKRRRNIGAQQIFGACPREVVPRICTPPLFDHIFPEKPMPSRDLQKFVHRLQFLRCFLSFFETCPHETCEAYTQRPVSSEACTSRRGGRSAARPTTSRREAVAQRGLPRAAGREAVAQRGLPRAAGEAVAQRGLPRAAGEAVAQRNVPFFFRFSFSHFRRG